MGLRGLMQSLNPWARKSKRNGRVRIGKKWELESILKLILSYPSIKFFIKGEDI